MTTNTSQPATDSITVRIVPNERGNPTAKLADAELHFGEGSGLAGLKLVGFSIWKRRGPGGRYVTFPARQYSVAGGERRGFILLRPVSDVSAQDVIRDRILQAYADYERAGT